MSCTDRHTKKEASEAFSYGLLITEVTEVDPTTFTFKGGSVVPGRYRVEDGRVEYRNDRGQQHAIIKYNEALSSA